jgi:sugar phosphate isomerase/epimerase
MTKGREFLLSSAAAAAGGSAWGQSADAAKLDRIAVMSLCFVPMLKGMARPGNPKSTLDLMDLGGMVAERYGIHRVEFQHTDFPSGEPAYFEEFHSRMKKANAQVHQINLDFANLNVSTPDPVIRLETMDLTRRWIDHAAVLECRRVMLNQGDLAPAVKAAAIEMLKAIGAYGKAKNVAVSVENLKAPWQGVVEVVKASEIAANPDSGNFPDKESRATGLAAMYGMTAGNSHIQHLPAKFDTAEAVRIAKEAGYKGTFSIETTAWNASDPYAPVRSILDILLANI